MHSYQTKEQRRNSEPTTKITLRPIREIKKMINLSWLIRETGVPKGTFMGWLRRGDNMLETKNDFPAEPRRKALRDMVRGLQKMRDKIDSVIKHYNEKLNQIEE